MADEKFFNFPVVLLQDAFSSIKNTMNNILDYAGYVHASKLDFGNVGERMKAAGNFFDINYGNVNSSYESGQTLFNSLPANLPMAGINKDVLFDYYKNYKTNDEIAVLLAFLAIKSIIGNKPYCKLTNDFLIARMAGSVRISELPHLLQEPLVHYATRRKLDKIKYELQANWNVNYYSHYTRGFFVSIGDKFPLNELVFQAEKRRKSTKEKQLKQKKDVARKLALQKLNNNSF